MPLRALFRCRHALAVASAIGTASMAQPVVAPGSAYRPDAVPDVASDLSLLTYNVKGLPWPLASGRPEALQRIGNRLAAMRADGNQPTVVVLQEAFIGEAKAIGARAGYPYQVQGPYLREQPGDTEIAGGRWYRGETQPSAVDSGLVVLSDLPVVAVRRAAFPTGACAGYDCLAAKGIVMVTLEVPGRGRVVIGTTHLNSRGASGAPHARTHAAFRRQVAFLARFMGQSADPMVIAGDFNRGGRPARIAALQTELHQPREALREVLNLPGSALSASADAQTVRGRARDMQLLFDGTDAKLVPTSAEITFGTERDGTMLSDHIGFTVHYRLTRRTNAT